ncbi:MAG: hypothetical protein JWM85_331 [Acidimicrobiaceae bacterium]|nr:hypothetical protein [Acidimicrobiaceae bacterium]
MEDQDTLVRIRELLGRQHSDSSPEGRRRYLAYLLAAEATEPVNDSLRESIAELSAHYEAA